MNEYGWWEDFNGDAMNVETYQGYDYSMTFPEIDFFMGTNEFIELFGDA
jgi:hypothetical protein